MTAFCGLELGFAVTVSIVYEITLIKVIEFRSDKIN